MVLVVSSAAGWRRTAPAARGRVPVAVSVCVSVGGQILRFPDSEILRI